MRLVLLFILLLIFSENYANELDQNSNVSKSIVEEFEKQFTLAKSYISTDSSKARFELNKIDLTNPELDDSAQIKFAWKKANFIADHFSNSDLVNELIKIKEIASQKDDSLFIAEACNRLTINYLENTQFDLATKEILISCRVYENRNLNNKLGAALLKLGAIEYSNGDFTNSIETIFRAADLFKEGDSRSHLAFSYLQIGITYLSIEKYNKAIKNYLLARDEFDFIKDTIGVVICNLNMALVYFDTKDYDSALTIYLKSKPAVYYSKRNIMITQFEHNLGKTYLALNQIDSAKHYFNKSLDKDKKMDYGMGMCANYTQLSALYQKSKMPDSAIYFGRKAIAILDSSSNMESEFVVTKILADCLFKKGKFNESAIFYGRHIATADSLENEKKLLDKIAEDQGLKIESYREKLFSARQREELIEQENKNQRQLIIGMTIFGFIMIGLLILVSIINRRNNNLNKELIDNQSVIENDLNVKKSLLKEIHHRVKNNLQVISSMLSIQNQYITDPQLNLIIEECKSRINSMALIHESLYKRDTNDITSFNTYIRTLIPTLIQTYQIDESRVKLKMEVIDIDLSIDESIPCGLLINEIISNSLKHAFPDEKNGKISIKMHQDNNTVHLSISDNGVGLPNSIKPDNQDTFGFLLIYTLASQLEAKMEIDKEHGLAFNFSWKMKNYEMLS